MFKRKKKAQETYNIPSVEEVDEIILKGKNLDLSIKENLLKKVRELSEYLKNRYAPYLEKFEREDIYVNLKDKSDWYSIYKDKVCVKTHNIIIVYDCHQLKFIERIDEIIEVADKKIIDYLNIKTKKNYRSNNKETIKHIKARINEEYKIEDFKKVIDNQCEKWMNTTMEDYLRPQTLFGTKFESYLNTNNYYNKPQKPSYELPTFN